MAKKAKVEEPAKEKKVTKKTPATAAKTAAAKKKDDIPTLEEVCTMIKKALEAQSQYTEELDLAINAAAGAYRSYLVAQKDMVKLKKTFYLTKTREGNKKYEPHPVIKVLKDTHDMVLASLKSLGLTLETINTAGVDPLAELVDKVRNLK